MTLYLTEEDVGALLTIDDALEAVEGSFRRLAAGQVQNVPRKRLRLEGEPTIIVQDGKPIERNLNRERLTVEEIAAEARQQQIASLDDVRWAVLEPSGNISFIPKQ